MKTKTLEVKTNKPNELINITNQIQNVIESSNIQNGFVILFVPHTTAAITINENADPNVLSDMIVGLNYISPDRSEYNHFEGNSDAHIKSSMIGVNQTIIIEDGKMLLGTWQGIYFCEFDGPRIRKLLIKIIEK